MWVVERAGRWVSNEGLWLAVRSVGTRVGTRGDGWVGEKVVPWGEWWDVQLVFVKADWWTGATAQWKALTKGFGMGATRAARRECGRAVSLGGPLEKWMAAQRGDALGIERAVSSAARKDFATAWR